MSRSGYTDDYGDDDHWALIRWRGAVASSIRGSRGQAFLRELADAMDAMPVKELVANEFKADGQFCTLAVVAERRGVDMTMLDPDDFDVRVKVARKLGIAEALAAEVMWENDEHVDEWRWIDVKICGPMRPHYPDWNRHTRSVSVPNEHAAAQRWLHMRRWVAEHITDAALSNATVPAEQQNNGDSQHG